MQTLVHWPPPLSQGVDGPEASEPNWRGHHKYSMAETWLSQSSWISLWQIDGLPLAYMGNGWKCLTARMHIQIPLRTHNVLSLFPSLRRMMVCEKLKDSMWDTYRLNTETKS